MTTTMAAEATSPQTQEDTSGDTGGGGTGDVSDEHIEQAVEQCKQAVDAYPQLSDDVKGDLEQICEDATDAAAEGDEDALEMPKGRSA